MYRYFCISFINFMFKGDSVRDFTNLFSVNNFNKSLYNSKLVSNYFFKMIEYNSIETANIYPNLNDQQQFRLNKINEVKDYFLQSLKKRINEIKA